MPAKQGKTGRPSQVVSLDAIGGRIRAAREKAGLSTTELGKRIGVSHVSIVRTELGETNPEKRTLILLAQVLHNDFGEAWLKPHAQEKVRSEVSALERELVSYFRLLPQDRASPYFC